MKELQKTCMSVLDSNTNALILHTPSFIYYVLVITINKNYVLKLSCFEQRVFLRVLPYSVK